MRARSERRQAILQGIQLLKQKQLTSVQQQRTEARSSYQRRRAALQQEITTRSQELALAQKQLQDLEPVRYWWDETNDGTRGTDGTGGLMGRRTDGTGD